MIFELVCMVGRSGQRPAPILTGKECVEKAPDAVVATGSFLNRVHYR
jgi:hypothetical protein